MTEQCNFNNLNVFFDLDGVLRDLAAKELYGYDPPKWDEKKDGKSFVDLVNEDLTILERAKPTEFYPLVKNCKMTILSCQLPEWRSRTDNWIKKHLPNATVIYFDHSADKMKFVEERQAIIFEDHPNLGDYHRVVLIDHPYNRHVKQPMIRCKNFEDFQTAIETIQQMASEPPSEY